MAPTDSVHQEVEERTADCPHCARGWVLDRVETTLGEYEDVSYLCPKCKGDYKAAGK